ncbi:RNA polymerase sigma factor [Agromyces sp. Root81]|uniref:RNA polymerase sigma factor n=1 Tax=Agromyces sp. Root81 TaxID=1736601 RepID=UPI000AF10901|nr:RNA polymerase sigma factor [Agromyces sp. Root81]
MSDDNEVIRRSADEPAVFGVLFDRHATSIHRYAARRLGQQAADDVMAETFLVAFERRAAFDVGVADARPWLFGIATTLMKQRARLEAKAWKGMVAALAAEITPDALERSDEQIDAERMSRRLASALRALHARDRDALLLYAWGDLDYEGVAAALGIPVGTVRSRLNRARRRLRGAVGADPTSDLERDHGRVDAAAQRA